MFKSRLRLDLECFMSRFVKMIKSATPRSGNTSSVVFVFENDSHTMVLPLDPSGGVPGHLDMQVLVHHAEQIITKP